MPRTLIIWVVLIVLLTAIYLELGTPSSQWLGRLGIMTVPLVFLVLLSVFLKRQRGGYQVNNNALTQLAEGRVVEALAAFEAAKKKMGNPIPLMNIGYAQLLLWRVQDAVGNLEAFARKSTSLNGVPGGVQLAAPTTALAHALIGNAEEAKKWLARSPGPSISKLAEIVLACRASDFSGAAKLLETHEVVLDQLGGTLRAFAETLSAYVASQTGGRSGTVDPVRMFRESSIDALKPVWPELHEFVVRSTKGPTVA